MATNDNTGCGVIGAGIAATAGLIAIYSFISGRDHLPVDEPRTPVPQSEPQAMPSRVPDVVRAPATTSQRDIIREEPTDAPIPTPEPPPDTPPDTILKIGHTWRQGGLEVRLSQHQDTFWQGWKGSGIALSAQISNQRSTPLALRWGPDNFSAVDNNGNDLEVGYGAPANSMSFNPIRDFEVILGPGQTGPLFESSYMYSMYMIAAPLADTSLSEIIVSVANISSIQHARWRVTIDH